MHSPTPVVSETKKCKCFPALFPKPCLVSVQIYIMGDKAICKDEDCIITRVARKVMPHIFFSFQNKDSNVKIERQQH